MFAVTMKSAGILLATVLLAEISSALSYAGPPATNAAFGYDTLEKLKPSLPKDMDVVSVGGYSTLMKYAEDPKAELVQLVTANLKSTGGQSAYTESGKVDALIALLQSQGKGFNSLKVNGEWVPVLQRQGRNSKILQKLVSKREGKGSKSFSNFFVKRMEFENLSYTRRGNGLLKALVKYTPVAKNFDKINGKIVLRRINCDIEGATFKYWKLPTIKLPLKRKGGFLDFLYMDEDIRVTKGNSGGLFVHARPAFYEKIMNE